jgi:acetyl-CoA carboxylase biotin carboxyl carrier protein
MIDLNKVEKLVDILENSGISELTVEEGDFKVTVKKEVGGSMVYTQPHIVPHAATASHAPAAAMARPRPAKRRAVCQAAREGG